MISCISTVFTWFVWNPVNTLQVVKFHRNLGFTQYLWSLPVLLTQPLAQTLQARDWTSLPFPSLNSQLEGFVPSFPSIWEPCLIWASMSPPSCHLCSELCSLSSMFFGFCSPFVPSSAMIPKPREEGLSHLHWLFHSERTPLLQNLFLNP